LEFNLEEFVKTLTDGVNLPEDQVKALSGVLAHEGIQTKLKDAVMMRRDYSKSLDQLREKETEVERLKRESEEFLREQMQLDHNNREEYTKLLQKTAELEAQLAKASSGSDIGDDIWGASDTTTNLPKGIITEEQLNNKLEEIKKQYMEAREADSLNTISLIADATAIAQRHRDEFNEPLDARSLLSFAAENRLPLDTAYNEWTSEKRQKMLEEKHKAEIEAARKEGEKSVLSKHNLPLPDRKPTSIHALRPPKDIPKTRSERVDAAVKDFMQNFSG